MPRRAGVNVWLGATGHTAIPLVKAMNLVTRRDAGGCGRGRAVESGRNLFQVPWRNRAAVRDMGGRTTGADSAGGIGDRA